MAEPACRQAGCVMAQWLNKEIVSVCTFFCIFVLTDNLVYDLQSTL